MSNSNISEGVLILTRAELDERLDRAKRKGIERGVRIGVFEARQQNPDAIINIDFGNIPAMNGKGGVSLAERPEPKAAAPEAPCGGQVGSTVSDEDREELDTIANLVASGIAGNLDSAQVGGAFIRAVQKSVIVGTIASLYRVEF